jgi:hypothetical protein
MCDLKIEPELGTGAKPMTEPQSRVAGDAAAAVNDLGHAIWRDVYKARELSWQNAELLKLFGEHFAWMDSRLWHGRFLFAGIVIIWTIYVNRKRESVHGIASWRTAAVLVPPGLSSASFGTNNNERKVRKWDSICMLLPRTRAC